jgi:CO dehydrogenase/acetyl-CoA synthase gamma subunit (corrinoid Fe-S protein)
VAKAIQKLHQKQDLYERLPKIDCGACGSPTCVTFAEDVVKGSATADDCVFITMKQFEALSANLLEKVRTHSQNVRDAREVSTP